MTAPTKNAYWTLVDEYTGSQLGTVETLTYEASAPGGKLVRTVTRNRQAFLVESMVFVPMPPTSPAV
jgi:hypothetical protein